MLSDLNFRPLSLSDKPLIEPCLSACGRELITYSFTSLYLWQHWDCFSWAMVDGVPVVRSEYMGRSMLLAPFTPEPDKLLAVTKKMLDLYHDAGRTLVLIELTAELRDFYLHGLPGLFAAEEFAAGNNYVYNSADLITLAGKHYDGKRNHLHHFMKDHPDWRLLPIDATIAAECEREFLVWNERLHQGDPELLLEAKGVILGLRNLQALGCDGGALYAGERLVAFTFGQPLTQQTYCIHVEKADVDVRGAYQAINAFFAKEYCAAYPFINRAEDMGSEGLRRAKESYRPCRLDKKYTLYPASCENGIWWEV